MTKIEDINDDVDQFHTILEALKNRLHAMEEINDSIVSLIDEDEYEAELVETADYMLELKIRMQKLEKRHPVAAVQPPPPTRNVNNNVDTNRVIIPPVDPSTHSFQGTASFSSSSYRLPKLTIPTFSGDVLKWQHFWDSLESMVHTNINLTDVQKFSYLQSQLDGDAARTIEGFPLTNANYNRAV